MGVEWSKKYSACVAVLFTLVFSLLSVIPARGQVTGATVSGTITDPSGGVVAGANVTTTNSATAAVREATSDSAGIYNLPNLTPGVYEVKVTAAGFSTNVQSGLSIAVGQQLQLNFALRVGQTSTEVQVTGAAPQIDLTSSAVTGQVESETVRELPLNGRDWTSLAQLQPGVKQIQTQMGFATSARGNRGFGGEMTISGQRSTFNNYRIDGINVNDYAMAAPGNVIGIVLGVDAIQEFQVLTSGFPAEYGRATGGVINAISRQGTNQFHGAVYEFLRNSSLDARPYFDRVNNRPNPPFKRNTFGASAGGRILKDRLFVFGDYEGIRQTKGLTSNSTVFSDNARLGILPVSNSAAAAAGQPAGTACTDLGGSPGHYLSPLANTCVNDYSAALLKLWPTSSAVKASNIDTATFLFSGVQRAPENFGTMRVDYKIGEKDSMFGTFLRDPASFTQPDAFNDVATESTTSRTTVAIEENHTFGSNFVNSARVGFNRDNVKNNFTPTAINPAAGDLALGGVPGQAAPRLSVGQGITDFFSGTNASSHYLHTWNSYQYADDAFWTRGAHTIKFGASVERMLYNQHTFQSPGGRYIFNNKAAKLPAGQASTSRILQFLSGEPSHYEAGLLNVVDNPREFRQTSMGFYVQDDWKFRSNLTLNIGLRYEPTTVLKDAQGRITNLAHISDTSPTCGTQFAAPIPPQAGSSCGAVGPYYKNPTLHNFEPRVGFAWDPFKNGKSSIRGSFGLYDVDPLAGYFLLQQNQAAPFFIFKSIDDLANFTPPAGSAFTGKFQAQEGGVQLTKSTNSKLSDSTIEGAPHRSYVEQWNLSLQRQLTSDMSLTVGYVGSHGLHLLMRGDDANMVGAPGTAAPALQTPYGYLFPNSGGTKPNPSLGVIRYVFWNTSSNYHGLNVNLDKKFAHGFQFQLAYTFSKSQDDDSQTIAGDTFANGINSPIWWLPHAYYGPSDFNISHTISLNALYTIPTPKSWNGFMREALADWELGGIFAYNSGTPTTVTNTGDPLGLGNQGADPYGPLVKLSGCNPINYTVGGKTVGFLNQSCFTEPSVPTSALTSAPFTTYGCAGFANAGKPPKADGTTFIPLAPSGQSYCGNLLPLNVGRNTITGPHLINMDFSVHKIFPITRISEQFNIQFRAEIFDIFNHSNFNPPQPNSGDTNSGLINADGSYAGVGNITSPANLQTPAREIQFALKLNW
jgi:hypothetical protein